MSDIANIAGHLGSSSARLARPERPESNPSTAPTAPHARFGRSNEDAVEISADARRLAAGRVAVEPAPDLAKVARMKAAIAGGGYDSDARLQIAIDRMIDDVLA
jgi:anti-sigma28 factor (negative regulator of flagellin synthesis)